MNRLTPLRVALVAVALSLIAAGAGAQPAITDADLQGRYAFRCSDSWTGAVWYDMCQGVFTADGSGNITSGVRTFFTGAKPLGIQVYEQFFTGTYTLGPEGMGTGTLHVTNPPPSFLPHEPFLIVVGGEGTASLLGYTAPAATSGSVRYYSWDARRQGESGAGSLSVLLERLDELESRLESLECEEIRLLLTPQGLRRSDCCGELVDFPDGKGGPTCGGSVVRPPQPVTRSVPRAPAVPRR